MDSVEDYYRRVKEMLAQLYIESAGCCGLNVCVERDIWTAGNSCCQVIAGQNIRRLNFREELA